VLYPLLQTPIWLLCQIGEIARQLDPMIQLITFLRFLGFIEKLVADPHVKTFVVIHTDDAFWGILEHTIVPPLPHLTVVWPHGCFVSSLAFSTFRVY
jgi:hypothetical protein